MRSLLMTGVLLLAACGSDVAERAATGALVGAGVGAVAGGPIGAAIGLGVGGVGGAALTEGLDQTAARLVPVTASEVEIGQPKLVPPGPPPSLMPVPAGIARRIQTFLNLKGYNAGPANGVIGEETQRALYYYQWEVGLPRTGIVDQATFDHLANDPEFRIGTVATDIPPPRR
jgi:Putative peptidoglycan binding domain